MSWASTLASLPRVALGHFPTPLEALPRLSGRLGGPTVWVKRDDVTGPAMGGNKTRKLEFLFGEAQAHGARAVATFGGLQSNFARQMVAAACSLGLEPHCFYFTPRPPRLEGNLLLAELMGARLHFIPFGQNDAASLTLERACRMVRRLVGITPGCWGKNTCFMPVGGHTPAGCAGYVLAAAEIDAQMRAHSVEQATVVTAAGTGGTLAGLLAGFHLLGSRHSVLGIDVGKLWRGFPASIAGLATDVCALLGQPHEFRPADVPLIEGRYVGEAYARPTDEALAAMRLAARLEGLVLDPVYTGKAMAGLIDLVTRGRWSVEDHVVFLHTGGAPAVWAYADAIHRGVAAMRVT